MQYAHGIRATRVKGGVQRESRNVYRMGRIADDLCGLVDLDEIRGCDFVESQPEWVDQKMSRLVRYRCRDVAVDQVVPAFERNEPVSGCQVHARRAFGFGSRCGWSSATRLQFKRHVSIVRAGSQP